MIKAIIESVEGADYFILNGVKRPRAYEAIGVNLLEGKQGVKIIPVHRDEVLIQETILFDEYQINGVVASSQDECISLLNEIVFKKGGGNGVGVTNSSIIPIGYWTIYKNCLNTDPEKISVLEPLDVAIGFIPETQIFIPVGQYLGGEIADVENSWNTSPMDFS